MKLIDGTLLGVAVSFAHNSKSADVHRAVGHFALEVSLRRDAGPYTITRGLWNLPTLRSDRNFGYFYLPVWESITAEHRVNIKLIRQSGMQMERGLTIALEARVLTARGLEVFHAKERIR
jgi:hypothetical protein